MYTNTKASMKNDEYYIFFKTDIISKYAQPSDFEAIHFTLFLALVAAAAAEIAKVLKVPSARDLVLGKKGAEMSYGPSPRQVQKEVHSKKHKLAGWLKTPSSEGEFKYHHTAVHVKNGCPKCHNQVQCTCACCTCTHTLTLSSLCIHASIFPVLNHFFTHVHPDGLGIGCARME